MIRFITFHVSPDGMIQCCQVGDMPAPAEFYFENCARVPFGFGVVHDGMEQELDRFLIENATAVAGPDGFHIELSVEATERFKLISRGHSTYAGIKAALVSGESLHSFTNQYLAARHSAEHCAVLGVECKPDRHADWLVDHILNMPQPSGFNRFEQRVQKIQAKP